MEHQTPTTVILDLPYKGFICAKIDIFLAFLVQLNPSLNNLFRRNITMKGLTTQDFVGHLNLIDNSVIQEFYKLSYLADKNG